MASTCQPAGEHHLQQRMLLITICWVHTIGYRKQVTLGLGLSEDNSELSPLLACVREMSACSTHAQHMDSKGYGR